VASPSEGYIGDVAPALDVPIQVVAEHNAIGRKPPQNARRQHRFRVSRIMLVSGACLVGAPRE
jgi:hypothetical protein